MKYRTSKQSLLFCFAVVLIFTMAGKVDAAQDPAQEDPVANAIEEETAAKAAKIVAEVHLVAANSQFDFVVAKLDLAMKEEAAAKLNVEALEARLKADSTSGELSVEAKTVIEAARTLTVAATESKNKAAEQLKAAEAEKNLALAKLAAAESRVTAAGLGVAAAVARSKADAVKDGNLTN